MNGRLEKFFKNPFEFKPERFLTNGSSEEKLVVIYILSNTVKPRFKTHDVLNVI